MSYKPTTSSISQIDFEKLQQRFNSGSKNIASEQLKGDIDKRVQKLLALNKTRVDLVDRFASLF